MVKSSSPVPGGPTGGRISGSKDGAAATTEAPDCNTGRRMRKPCDRAGILSDSQSYPCPLNLQFVDSILRESINELFNFFYVHEYSNPF